MRPMAFKKKEIKGPVVNDDLYVPSTLKKLLSMKKGKEKRGSERRTGSTPSAVTAAARNDVRPCESPAIPNKERKKNEDSKRKSTSAGKEKANTDKNVMGLMKKEGASEEETLLSKKEKRKEFLRRKKDRKMADASQNDQIHGKRFGGADTSVSFGEQAEQPLESNLKRKHWVQPDSASLPSIKRPSKPAILHRLDSKTLASLYRKSKQPDAAVKGRATMDSLKKLVQKGHEDGNNFSAGSDQ